MRDMLMIVSIIVLSFSIILIVQGVFNIYLLLYHWSRVRKILNFRSPKVYIRPQLSFTALVPARHEEDVISDTIRAVAQIDYPVELTEVLVVLRKDDEGTIRQAEAALDTIGRKNTRIVVFDGFPINKPHGLNIALEEAHNDVVVIFDAEDEPHKDIYNIVNTVMVKEEAAVVQCGVQLMNFHSNWYSLFNVLEYYFWFKSCLQFFADKGVIPLGGNTVFFKRDVLKEAGGWDEKCLTEDADIGLKLSLSGAKIRVIYDEEHSTREETPPDLKGFIKQRTRWNLGFMQIIKKGTWRKFNNGYQQLLALYTLGWPCMQAVLFILIPFSIATAVFVRLPVVVTLISTIPLYILLVQLTITIIGFYEFTRDYKLPFQLKYILKMAIFFIPYQTVLGFSALRAGYRYAVNNVSWEKTTHINAHRGKEPLTPTTQ